MDLLEAWKLVKNEKGEAIRIVKAERNTDGDWVIEYEPIRTGFTAVVQQDGKVIL